MKRTRVKPFPRRGLPALELVEFTTRIRNENNQSIVGERWVGYHDDTPLPNAKRARVPDGPKAAPAPPAAYDSVHDALVDTGLHPACTLPLDDLDASLEPPTMPAEDATMSTQDPPGCSSQGRPDLEAPQDPARGKKTVCDLRNEIWKLLILS